MDKDIFIKLLAQREFKAVRSILDVMNEVDIASLLSTLSDKELALAFRLIPKDKAAEVFSNMDTSMQTYLVTMFTEKELKELLDDLYMDDTVDMLEELPANLVKRILATVSASDRSMINQLLNYPEDSAGSIMTTEYVDLREEMTVGQAMAHIKKTGIHKETIYTCYVLSADRTLQGIVTVKDSSWLMSWTINRQPQFRDQPKDHCLVWVYSLFTDKPGDFVKKPMRDCTGKEICMEWLYHIGVPEEQIEDLAANSANTVPVMMPYIDAFFMPRAYGDRPKVVPDGSVNFAFLGQFAETPRDTIFTTEYSMRTGMEAVYTLLNVDRGVPEVWGSVYDVRDLLNATVKLRDGKKATDMDLSFGEKMVLKKALSKIGGTDVEKLLKQYGVI